MNKKMKISILLVLTIFVTVAYSNYYEALLRVGNFYLEIGEHKNALKVFEEAWGMNRKINSHKDILDAFTLLKNIGISDVYLDQYDEALESFKNHWKCTKKFVKMKFHLY
jgi:tetratricopeptide (TPR) repeat protein